MEQSMHTLSQHHPVASFSPRCHTYKIMEAFWPDEQGLSICPDHSVANRIPTFLFMTLSQDPHRMYSLSMIEGPWETVFSQTWYFPSSKYSALSEAANGMRTLESSLLNDNLFYVSDLTPVVHNFLIFKTRLSLFLTS